MAARDAGEVLGLYGTLLDPDVRTAVFGNVYRYRGRWAVLAGWERVYVAGAAYPGLRPAAGSAVDVWVIDGIRPDLLAVADGYEGDGYERRLLPVTFEGGETGEAAFYLPCPSVRLSSRAWVLDAAWRETQLADALEEARAAAAAWREQRWQDNTAG